MVIRAMEAVLEFEDADGRQHNLVLAVNVLQSTQQVADRSGLTLGGDHDAQNRELVPRRWLEWCVHARTRQRARLPRTPGPEPVAVRTSALPPSRARCTRSDSGPHQLAA